MSSILTELKTMTGGQLLTGMRKPLACVVALLMLVAYALLFTGGQAHDNSFSAWNLHVQYEIKSIGIRPERIEYVVVSDGRYDKQTIQGADDEETTFTRIYRSAGLDTTVAFKTKHGQTVWIGKDRKVRFAPTPLLMSDVHLLEKHSGSDSSQTIGSLEELEAAIAKLKANKETGI
ncbi:MAG: hypothetical protein PHX41_00545 [Kiritimatiellae bacterium]|nr:hypothetical protein [Kiritimatiellia bacterium]